MIYFFAKGPHFTQCEILPGSPHLLRVLDPLGRQHTESYTSPRDLDDRWSEITQQLRQAGWFGPFGRDPRA